MSFSASRQEEKARKILQSGGHGEHKSGSTREEMQAIVELALAWV